MGWRDKGQGLEVVDSDKITCPRRIENFNEELLQDSFAPGHGLVSQAKGCSYCGSLDPDTFMQWIRDGGRISGTDKNYKAYISPPGNDSGHEAKFYYQHLSVEQRREFIELYNNKTMKFTELKDADGKVYYKDGLYVTPFFCQRAVEGESK